MELSIGELAHIEAAIKEQAIRMAKRCRSHELKAWERRVIENELKTIGELQKRVKAEIARRMGG